jgi:hypothetical protein
VPIGRNEFNAVTDHMSVKVFTLLDSNRDTAYNLTEIARALYPKQADGPQALALSRALYATLLRLEHGGSVDSRVVGTELYYVVNLRPAQGDPNKRQM